MNILKRLFGRDPGWGRSQADVPSEYPHNKYKQISLPASAVPEQWQLEHPLFAFSPVDVWTLADACEGTQVFGSSGSGKTSGSGNMIARSFLENGFGGLVLCAKPDEAEDWQERLEEVGRAQDMVRVTFEGQHRMNILDYEMRRKDRGGGKTENIVNLISTITDIAENKQDAGGGDDFWPRAMREMLRNAVDLLKVSGQSISFENLMQLVSSAPTSPEQVSDPEANKAWRERSFCALCLAKAGMRKDKSAIEEHNYEIARRYWLHHFPGLGSRTRSSIVATFTSVADQLQHDEAHQLFGTDTNFVPELAYKNGAIIVLDMSVQEYGELGRIAQGMLKYVFQRAILRRKAKQHPRPVFLWADEAQNFISPYDYQFQAVARSARACTVYLTQNIRNYHAVLGSHGVAEADALLGNFQTKIFHANADTHTNQYAADLIAQDWTYVSNYNTGMNGAAMDFNRSAGGSQSVQYKVLPVEFTKLRKGGFANNLQVDGIVFQGGRIFQATQDTFLRAVFVQGQ